MSEAGNQESLWPKSMICHDVTLSTTAENLALDEALLAEVEANPTSGCLRFWQPAEYSVVLGRSNNPLTEVEIDYCVAQRIPILRRASGGGTVLIGPGCLCYSLILPLTAGHRSLGVAPVTTELMSRTAAGLGAVVPGIQVRGTSDLTWNGLKFSGNAQRWLRQSFVHHGTILFDFNLVLLERCLRHPTREPIYRQSRRHVEFLVNLPMESLALRHCLMSTWNTDSTDCPATVLEAAGRMAGSRYRDKDWMFSP